MFCNVFCGFNNIVWEYARTVGTRHIWAWKTFGEHIHFKFLSVFNNIDLHIRILCEQLCRLISLISTIMQFLDFGAKHFFFGEPLGKPRGASKKHCGRVRFDHVLVGFNIFLKPICESALVVIRNFMVLILLYGNTRA